LKPEHKFLILACDGLWDVCTHREAADLVNEAFKNGKNPTDVSKELVKYALDRRTEDNVTVVVIKIDWEETPPQSEPNPNTASTPAVNDCSS